MPDIETEIRERERAVASNEDARQSTSSIRVSAWALFFGLIIIGVLVAYLGMMQK